MNKKIVLSNSPMLMLQLIDPVSKLVMFSHLFLLNLLINQLHRYHDNDSSADSVLGQEFGGTVRRFLFDRVGH